MTQTPGKGAEEGKDGLPRVTVRPDGPAGQGSPWNS